MEDPIQLKDAVMAWNERTLEFKLFEFGRGPIPESFPMTHGAVWSFYRNMVPDDQLSFLLQHAWKIALRAGIPQSAVHSELLRIDRYRDFFEG